MAAERTIIEIDLVPDLLVDGPRDADSTGLGECLEPGSDVDAIAKDVVTVGDHVAEIDADPQLETARGRDGVVDGTRGALHLDGAVQRVDDTRKVSQQAVARYLGPELPASAVSAVPKLSAGPDFLVEIEAIANLN